MDYFSTKKYVTEALISRAESIVCKQAVMVAYQLIDNYKYRRGYCTSKVVVMLRLSTKSDNIAIFILDLNIYVGVSVFNLKYSFGITTKIKKKISWAKTEKLCYN